MQSVLAAEGLVRWGKRLTRMAQAHSGHKPPRPSSGMAVCTTQDPNVSDSVWPGGLPARLTGLTARFPRRLMVDAEVLGDFRKRIDLFRRLTPG